MHRRPRVTSAIEDEVLVAAAYANLFGTAQQHAQLAGVSPLLTTVKRRDGLGALHRIEGSLTAEKYSEILEYVMIPYALDGPFPDGDYLFQQDLAPVHTAKSVKKSLTDRGVHQLEWILKVLECGGSLLDAVAVAVKAALHDLKIPKVSVSVDEDGQPEIEVSDDPFDVTKLDIANVPCLVTLSKVARDLGVALNKAVDEQLELEGSITGQTKGFLR
ncbi:hypothetical protein HPB48_018009 [Haemaphysalis longicornis]|uniref:Ribosomal RNA-processing protein 42 n=1 Tax=Haemaphysalis longicornis TaxID=44386 RepID=A0A9J6FH63_HAELO|nr:hypothetical protein HPB48_018009 [Haemaphysalis longicornis]